MLQGQLNLIVPGTFSYSGPSFDKGVPSYKMNGTIRVVKQPLSTSFNTTTNASSSTSPAAVTTKKADTITTLMVPANQLGKAISGLKSQGFGIDNQYSFNSWRRQTSSTPDIDKFG